MDRENMPKSHLFDNIVEIGSLFENNDFPHPGPTQPRASPLQSPIPGQK